MEVQHRHSQSNESISSRRSASAPRRNKSQRDQRGFLLDRCDSNNNNHHQPQSSNMNNRGSWGGFLTAPPKRGNKPTCTTTRKESTPESRSIKDEQKLLQQTEELLRLILQDDQISINEISLQQALSISRKQLSSSLHKMRYSYMLEKPWRTTTTDHSSENGVQEKITKVEIANPKNFRRSHSLPKETADCNGDEHESQNESLKSQLEHQKRQCHKLREKLKIVLMGSDERELDNFLNEFSEDDNDDYLDSVHTEAYERLQKQLQTTKHQLEKAQRQLQEADITAASTSYENDPTIMQSLKVELAVAQAKAEMAERKLQKLEQEHHEYIQTVSDKLTSVESDADVKLQRCQSRLLEVQRQLEKTQIESRNHQARTQTLQKQIEELEKELDMTRETLNQDVVEKHTLQERITQLENEQAEHQRSTESCVHTMQNTLDSLQSELNAANRKLEESSEGYMNEIDKLSQELEKSKSLRQAAEHESQRLKEANTNHENQIDVLQRSLLDANARNSETEHDLTLKVRENELLSEEIRESEAHIAQLLDELQVLQPLAKDLEVAESELEIAKKTIQDLEQKIHREEYMNRKELEASQNIVSERIQQMEAKHAAELEEFRKKLDVVHSKNEQLTLALDELQKASIQKLQLREEEASRKIADIQYNVSCLRDQLEQKQKDNENLRSQLDNHLTQLSIIRQENEDSQIERIRLIQQIEQLQSERESNGSSLKAKNHKLEELLRRKENAYQNLQSELIQQSLQYKDVRQVLKDAEEKNNQLSQDIREMKESQEKANNMMKVLEAQNQKLRDQSSRKDQQIQNLMTKMDEYSSRYKEVCQQLETSHRQSSAAVQRSPDSINKIKELEDLLQVRDREIKSFQSKVEDQQNRILTFIARIESLEEEQKNSRAKIQELSKHQKTDESTQLLLDKTLECAELMAEQDILQRKLHILETKMEGLENENLQKADLIQSLMSSMSLTTSPSQNGSSVLERFHNERERVMKRTADLSIQLAESQLKIDQLTEELRKVNKTTSTTLPPLPPPTKPTKSQSTSEPQSPVAPRRNFSTRTFSNLFQDSRIGEKLMGASLDNSARAEKTTETATDQQ